MASRVEVVFFDIGGTLVLDNGFREVLARNLANCISGEVGLRLEPEEALRVWEAVPSDDDIELWDLVHAMLFLRELGLKPRMNLAEKVYRSVLDSYIEGFKLDPASHSVLESVKRMGLTVGIITNVGSYEVVSRRLKEEGLARYVDVVVASQAVAWRKPSRKIFDLACRLAGAEPTSCVHVGDDPVADVEGAKRAGMRAIQVLRDTSKKSQSADAWVYALSEVPGVIERWLNSA